MVLCVAEGRRTEAAGKGPFLGVLGVRGDGARTGCLDSESGFSHFFGTKTRILLDLTGGLLEF